MKIAIIGHKRIPSNEGGIEKGVEQHAVRMVQRGNDVTVYNRGGHNVFGKEFDGKKLKKYKGINIVTVPTVKGAACVPIYSFLATIHAAFSRYDCVSFRASGSCAMIPLAKLFGLRVVASLHGIDSQRDKWGGFASKYLEFGERMAATKADVCLVLSKNMKEYIDTKYGVNSILFANGIDKPKSHAPEIIKEKYGLEKNEYILSLGRIVPEKGIQYDGIFGIKADAWSAILLEKNEEYLEDEYSRPDAALTVISREQALRLFDEGKQIYLIRISPWPVLVTGREEIERGSDYFQIAKEDLEKDKQKTMENSEKAPVEKLAADLDEFAFDFDFYHYKDSVEDREQAVEALKEQIQAGDVQPIREWLQDAVEESEGESAEKAVELITRLDALVKEQKLLSGSEKQFGIYQITARDQEHDYRFMNLDFVKRHGMEVNRADYELVYTAPLTEKDTLEAIYERFNIQRPADFTGHSLSVSDVVVLNDGKSIKACYVDSIGFAELPDFFKERKIDLQKETILDQEHWLFS